MIVDAQQGILEGEKAVPAAAAITDRLVELLTAARAAGALVVHLQHDGALGSLDEPQTPGWFIHPKLSPYPEEVVVRKTEDDGLDDLGLGERIRVERSRVKSPGNNE